MHDFICFVREFRVLLSLFLMLCVLHGLVPLAVSAESPAFPSDVQKAIDKSEADISMINAKAAQEEAKVRKALVAVLIKAQEKATKSGNLDAANAIKARVTEESKRLEVPDLLANADTPIIVGKWDRNGKVWDFQADHTLIETRNGTVLARGTWQESGKNLSATLGAYTITITGIPSPDRMEVIVVGPGAAPGQNVLTRIEK